MKTETVNAINLNTSNKQIIDSLIQSMDKVMFLLIGLAALLAVVVIFTLTTANLEERMREFSTLKFLGFYNKASLYIYRETILLSIFGILFGFLIGNWLHNFIIDNLAPMNAMFKPEILISNYLLSAMILLIITAIMAIFVSYKIKKLICLKR